MSMSFLSALFSNAGGLTGLATGGGGLSSMGGAEAAGAGAGAAGAGATGAGGGFWSKLGNAAMAQQGTSSGGSRNEKDAWMQWAGGSLTPSAKSAISGGGTTPTTGTGKGQKTIKEQLEAIQAYRKQRNEALAAARAPIQGNPNYPLSNEPYDYTTDDPYSPLYGSSTYQPGYGSYEAPPSWKRTAEEYYGW